MREPPERIWLQFHGDGEPDDIGEVSAGDVTWCKDKVFNHDMEYVRIQAQETLEMQCEARFNEDGTLDEIVGFGTFHLEQMDNGHWWMQLGPHMVNLTSKGKVTAYFRENEADDNC